MFFGWISCFFLLPVSSAFKWGVSTSAYQIEGGWNAEGKGLSVWDTFSHEAGHILDGTTADISCDHYNQWEEDLNWIKWLGVDAYRFSLSWSRILPKGTTEIVNQKGVEFYNHLIDGLLERNIEPMITLWHWDTPQILQDNYKGWENDLILDDFTNYADICFQLFGDRVKYWITLNEPLTVILMGYALGRHAPGVAESEKLPYEVGHRMIRAHAKVYYHFHNNYPDQNGKVSIALNSDFYYPASDTSEDKKASERALLWRMGLFADPLFFGDYPLELKERCKDRLPTFLEEDHIYGTLDFFALNHYTSLMTKHDPNTNLNFFNDPEASYSFPLNSTVSASSWLVSYPPGIRDMILWIQDRYDLLGQELSLVITESGVSTYPGDLEDESRINYIGSYSNEVKKVEEEGIVVSHYCVWSFLDNFEWSAGYTERFGLFDVDFQSEKKIRTPKWSAFWLKEELEN